MLVYRYIFVAILYGNYQKSKYAKKLENVKIQIYLLFFNN